MAILPARDRDKYMLFVIVASLVVGYGYYDYLWSPKNDELSTSQARVDSLVVMAIQPPRSRMATSPGVVIVEASARPSVASRGASAATSSSLIRCCASVEPSASRRTAA